MVYAAFPFSLMVVVAVYYSLEEGSGQHEFQFTNINTLGTIIFPKYGFLFLDSTVFCLFRVHFKSGSNNLFFFII